MKVDIWRCLRKSLIPLIVMVAVILTGLGSNGSYERTYANPYAYNSSDNWVVYWYICGSDLETQYGSATTDIEELLDVNLPPNVKVVFQTGGSYEWQNDVMGNNVIGRYLYDASGLHELEMVPDADMGDKSTLQNFLQFGKDNYPADHRVFVFWNHGGGTTGGVCVDERTDNSLSLNDIQNAFAGVYGTSQEAPPFELVGFDACLMGTYDVANMLNGISRYMTASEEIEPSNGWDYAGWVRALAQNPSMDGATLGRSICDSYMIGCEEYGTEETATLSVVDLSRVPAVKSAYESFGVEALGQAKNNPQKFFSDFGRDAQRAENYGGNTREQGYSNMVDLGDLAYRAQHIMPRTAQQLMNSIDNAVVYKVQGEYRRRGSGLSGYYPYDGDVDNYSSYVDQDAASFAHKCLYYYLLSGEWPEEADNVLAGSSLGNSALPTPQATSFHKLCDVSQLEDTPVNIDNDGISYVSLSEQQMDMLSAVHCQLVYIDEKEDVLLALGSDSNIIGDWDSGIFKDNFYGKWPMLDGHPVYVEITAEEDDYNIYSIPIKLNGVECNLQVSYSYNDEKYHIIGAWKGIDDNGMGDRHFMKLKAGDTVTTIHYAMPLSSNTNEYVPVEAETFTIGSNPVFDDAETGDGLYGYFFEFVSPTGDSSFSQMVQFTIKNGEITTDV
ncbi:clostripain-related cysteine peptidase [Anaerovibrio lipolyticus]|uniref:clostripain-related cysteine peptidase n=1 Tax=Anaerovibrio lipolyticus TaxID=82374 RepID=UPI00055B6422|nr:clostripain-related cysteine peptidase [Anaerovibrio lipolyticus]